MKIDHRFDPLETAPDRCQCGAPREKHRVEHAFLGEGLLCATCDLPPQSHRAPRERDRSARVRVRYDHPYEGDGEACERCHRSKETHPAQKDDRFMGLDGEGKNDRGGRHRYTYMACVDQSGVTVGEVEATRTTGLSTVECLEFLLELPTKQAKCFAYSFGYDLTKILEDVDECSLYRLFRPDTRKRLVHKKGGGPAFGFYPVYWKDYRLTYLNGQFGVARVERSPKGEIVVDPEGRPMTSPALIVHDIWRFFGSKFTNALEDWKVGTPEEIAAMRDMKDKRSEFDKQDQEAIRAYCLKECQFMAELAVKLRSAHKAAKIPLRHWYGAGSTASGLLETMGIKEHLKAWKGIQEKEAVERAHGGRGRREIFPEAMREPVAAAFFGGRFENSVLGPVEGIVHSYDISSAYPYQCCFLPCLLHSSWERVEGSRAEEAAFQNEAALLHYVLHEPSTRGAPWGPLPFRLQEGSICFPNQSAGGWIWRDEYFAARRMFDSLECTEAWIYKRGNCSCRPFERMPSFYLERVRIGKEGPGIVIKGGCNSVYGKCAQSSGGGGAFTCWIWAGMITSGCRAQALEVMGLHRDLRNLLMIATDGIATREKLVMPEPRVTGTEGRLECPVGKDSPEGWTVKPLGGWEYKLLEKGMFLARPGIYFPLNPTDKELKYVRARGVGRTVMYEQWRTLVEEYERAARGDGRTAKGERGVGLEQAVVHVKDLSRFVGAKTGITRSDGVRVKVEGGGTREKWKYKRSERFGQWITRPVDMSFNPKPKREGILLEDGVRRLGVRSMAGIVSKAYDPAVVSPEAQVLKDLMSELLEQPDGGDFSWGMAAEGGV